MGDADVNSHSEQADSSEQVIDIFDVSKTNASNEQGNIIIEDELSHSTPVMEISRKPRRAEVLGSSSEDRRVEPESGKAYTFHEFETAFAEQFAPDDILAYWRDACTPLA